MIYIGCHLSVTDGYEAMGKTMTVFGGNTFAWFTRNPRGGKSKPIIKEDVEALLEYVSSKGFGPLVAHGSYTMNLCSSNEETRKNGFEMLKKDLVIMEMVPGNLYNFHPGSHTGQGTKTGIEEIADALNSAMHPALQNLPFILETPNEDEGYIEEIKTVKKWFRNKSRL